MAGTGRVHELNAPDLLSQNDAAHPDVIRPTQRPLGKVSPSFLYDLPAHSASILEIDLETR